MNQYTRRASDLLDDDLPTDAGLLLACAVSVVAVVVLAVLFT